MLSQDQFYASILVVSLLSPSYWIAEYLYERVNRYKLTRLLNWSYFAISVLSIFILLLMAVLGWLVSDFYATFHPLFLWFWSVHLLSRSSHVFYAYLIDACQKIHHHKEKEDINLSSSFVALLKKLFGWCGKYISPKPIASYQRPVMALRSYAGIMLDFSILYLLLPTSFWKDNHSFAHIMEAMYFSGVTITTLGYGDISPVHWFSQFLAVFEVSCGFALIFVCFSIYLSENEIHRKSKTWKE